VTRGGVAAATALAVADWRTQVFRLYDRVREASAIDPARGHATWCAGRDELFANHPATPLLPADRAAFRGLPVAPYDPAWRFELPVRPAEGRLERPVPTGTDGVVPFERLGTLDVPGVGSLAVWRLTSYAGGLFVPVQDALARVPGGNYGGGRYLIDTVKGADLGHGADPGTVVVDFNFAYNPSCAYDPAWACPLASPDNTVTVEVPVGERYEASP
jgi:uncharacterized protein (DUF1684 family)